MRFVLAAITTLVFTCGLVKAEPFTEEQLAPWTALEEQVDLGMRHQWDAMEKYLHPNLSAWGDSLPAPIAFSGKAYDYFRKLGETDDMLVAHHLVPVSVTVVGDVAIINAYHHVLTKDDEGEAKETIYRLHNTWKKGDGQWKLLATYNTVVPSMGDHDD